MAIDNDHVEVTQMIKDVTPLLDSDGSKEVILAIIKTVADPFLITALVVVFLMFILLLKKEKTHRETSKELFNEIHALAITVTELSTTLNTLVKWVMVNEKRRHEEN